MKTESVGVGTSRTDTTREEPAPAADEPSESADPAAIVTTIVASRCNAVRLHGESGVVQVGLASPGWRLEAPGTIELDSRCGRVRFRAAEMPHLRRDTEEGRLAALSHDGDLIVEWDLEEWFGHGEASSLVGTPPSRGSFGRAELSADIEIHATDFDADLYAEAWRNCRTFRETMKLGRAARRDRRSLLQRLPSECVRRLHPSCLDRILTRLGSYDGRVFLQGAGAGHRYELELRNRDVRGAGTVTTLEAAGVDAVFDWSNVGAAFLVMLPGDRGMARAVEVVDSSGGFALRFRRSYDALPSRVFAWRAALNPASRT